jgi:hypothetical protein
MIDQFIRAVSRAGKPVRKLFAGHRGVGKTTELNRLKRKLEATDGGRLPYQVVWIDAARTLAVNDLDFPDLLVLIASEVQIHLRDAQIAGFSGTTPYLQRLWDEFQTLLGSTVYLSKAKLELPFNSLDLEFRNRPNQRRLLREKIEAIVTDLLAAVNQLLDEATVTLKKQGKAGLVLIIDGLDKVKRRILPNGQSNLDRLFFDRSESLAGLNAHAMYTLPISLYYSSQHALLQHVFGECNPPVVMSRLRDSRDQPITTSSHGKQKLWEMLDSRCNHAGVTMTEAFDTNTTWQRLCMMSGGHPRQLLSLVRAATSKLDALPITRVALDEVLMEMGNSYLRQVPDPFWEKLRPFDNPVEHIMKDEDHQQMLSSLYIFEYVTDRPWYEVNPILRTLERFSR